MMVMVMVVLAVLVVFDDDGRESRIVREAEAEAEMTVQPSYHFGRSRRVEVNDGEYGGEWW